MSKHPAPHACPRRPALPVRSRGFSMLELMIALTIGLFLVAGVGGILLSMRGSFKTQDGLTQMQENARFLLSVMDTMVSNAGYFPDPVNTTIVSALPVPATSNPDGTSFAAGQFITGTTGGTGASDTLDVRFQTANGDGLMNCNGGTNASGGKNVFTNSFAVTAAGELTCAVAINGAAPGPAAILIDNVSTMKVLYGVDTDGDGNTDTYQTAATVQATGNWGKVSSVQLTLTLKDLVNSTTVTTVNLPKTLLHTIYLMNRR
jgi:type IV pilus assembly protein PilW